MTVATVRWTADQMLRTLLPECAPLDVRRVELPNLSALNFVIAGLLGEGVASSTRPIWARQSASQNVQGRKAPSVPGNPSTPELFS